MVETKEIKLNTKGNTDIIDITGRVESAVRDSNVSNGIVTVFVPGATGGITTVEYEPGLVRDLKRLFEEVASKKKDYAHNLQWGDGNGYSHVRASLLGPSLTIPFRDKELIRGTWQQVVFIDFDNRPRARKIVVQIIGE